MYPKLVVAEPEGEEDVAFFSADSLASFDPSDAKPTLEVEERKRPRLASASRAGTSMRRSDISTADANALDDLW